MYGGTHAAGVHGSKACDISWGCDRHTERYCAGGRVRSREEQRRQGVPCQRAGAALSSGQQAHHDRSWGAGTPGLQLQQVRAAQPPLARLAAAGDLQGLLWVRPTSGGVSCRK
jgi:hypothetical protein